MTEVLAAPEAHSSPAAPDAPSTPAAPQVEVMGVRHHGPGSARAVLAALDRLRPDVVLVEGPSDADPLAALGDHPGLVPPVALLAYENDAPAVAAFWPFAVFSPEWQALRWAADHGVPVRFCDLPTSAVLGEPDLDGPGPAEPPTAADLPGAHVLPEDALDPEEDPGAPEDPAVDLRRDPVAALAAAAGYTDPERWWEDVVESRRDAPTPFPVLTEAMAELRAAAAPLPAAEQLREDRREAYMRQTLRAVLKGGAQRVAVVCGAWHAPALDGRLPPAAGDVRTLRGLPRRGTSVTWVPWTSSRLARTSGYGAGITSPGWYHHLFVSEDDVVARWLVKVARVLREKDLPVSSAHVIEAVRLADALASMRGRPVAGLEEVTEATRAVLCDGDDTLLGLVTGRLVVGEALGTVPDSVPTVPLAADLRAVSRRLRLPQEALERTLELDLRKPTDLGRSRLLHRLTLLGIAWGTPAAPRTRSTGTFRETWSVRWRPELSVSVVEASLWGTTVVAAATARAVDTAAHGTLPQVTALVEQCLLADLPDALAPLLEQLDVRAARDEDITHLAAALPPLVRAERYTDVRGTDTEGLSRVADALLVRLCAMLPAAVTNLDDDAARALRASLDAVHDAVLLRDDDGSGRDLWLRSLLVVANRAEGAHPVSGILSGRAARLLRDVGHISPADASVRLGRVLSVGTPVPVKAAWVEGFLDGGGLLLVNDPELLGLLDGWVTSLTEEAFVDVLPLLRRTFGTFVAPERRAVGDAVRRRPAATSTVPTTFRDLDLDEAQVLPALATVALILGAT